MKDSKIIFFTVTNDLNYDQRMIRICTTLSKQGYNVHLVGREMPGSPPLKYQPFKQTRLKCRNNKGKLFYLEYNYRLYRFLKGQEMDGICAIDLDTIIPVYYVSKHRKCIRLFDSHELFCEMKEIVTRPTIYKFWKTIEKKFVPEFNLGYTVNKPIADIFKSDYGKDYAVIRNMPTHISLQNSPKEKFILCQGAVNEARCFETLLPAMKNINYNLIVAGDGNFLQEAKQIASESGVNNKVEFTGMLPPEELKELTAKAYLGLTLIENNGQSNYLSLANRFFDYAQGLTPQICVNFPAYKEINDKYQIAEMIDATDSITISESINKVMENNSLWETLYHNCKPAAEELTWENEEIKLIQFYKKAFGQ